MLTRKLQDSPLRLFVFQTCMNLIFLFSYVDDAEKGFIQWRCRRRRKKSAINHFGDFFSRCLSMRFMMDQKPTEKGHKMLLLTQISLLPAL